VIAMTSTQTIVVHHWSPDFDPDVVRGIGMLNEAQESCDVVYPAPFECSVPFKVVVIEEVSGKFRFKDLPHRCPLCDRAFGSLDQRRIGNRAMEQHLNTTSFLEPGVVEEKTGDVVLDI
jgi:hypothetical protein